MHVVKDQLTTGSHIKYIIEKIYTKRLKYGIGMHRRLGSYSQWQVATL